MAKDVCAALGYKGKPAQNLQHLDDDEKGIVSIDTPGGLQPVRIVNESALYTLILKSRMPLAKAFKRWVTHEMLPSIRKSGEHILDLPPLFS